jgi:hypothetical protein
MAKRTTTKKPITKQHQEKHRIRHRIILGVGVVVIAVLVGLTFSLIVLPRISNGIRLNRINEIYSSIQLPQNTYFNTEDVFGDMRPYSYDESRSQSSVKTFVVAKTVSDTTALMDESIKAARHTFFEEAYKGSTFKEYHYKTSRGEYIRLNVSSKLRDDIFSNTYLMNGDYTEDIFDVDPNSGPSTVTLKVNLDDNNE